MAFKMKGYPQHSGVGGVQVEKELETEMREGSTNEPKMTKTKTKAEKSKTGFEGLGGEFVEEVLQVPLQTGITTAGSTLATGAVTGAGSLAGSTKSSPNKLMKWAHNKKADPGSSFKWVQAAAQLAPIAMEMKKSKEEE
jgi:hypothetical protein